MKRILMGIAAMAMLAGCSKDEEPVTPESPVVEAKKVFTQLGASLSETRTSLSQADDNGLRKVLWAAGDQIAVYSDEVTTPVIFNLDAGCEGSENATFSVPEGSEGITGTTFYAVYPASASVSGNSTTITLPALQNMREKDATENVEDNLYAMAATGTSLESLQFHALCGILVVELAANEAGVNVNTIDLSSTTSLCGTGEINFSDFSIKMKDISRALSLNCKETVLGTDATAKKKFFFVVPAGDYANVGVRVYAKGGLDAVIEKTRTVGFTVGAGKVTYVGANFMLNTKTYSVGDLYDANGLKGVVFETSDAGRSGKIVALNDCNNSQPISWGPTTGVKGVTDSANGANNQAKITSDIIADYPAFKACADLGDGWYLPASGEMSVINDQWAAIEDVLNATDGASVMDAENYWCSNVTGRGSSIYYLSYDVLKTVAPADQNTVTVNVRAVAAF